MTLTIKVAEVRWPAEGKKTGLVTDQSGKQWGAFPEVLGMLQVDSTYQITYASRQWNNKTYYTITKAFPVSGSNQMPNTQAAPPPARPMTPRPMTSQSDNERRLDIFVCGGFNNIMSNPNVNPSDLSMIEMIDMLHKLKAAWNGVFGPSPIPRPAPQPRPQQQSLPTDIQGPADDDMNDQIPF